MKKFLCPVCERIVDDEIIPFHKNVERQLLEFIQRNNPRWVEFDGFSPKVMDYYRALIFNKLLRQR